jgi:hypothetical protein
LSFLLFCWMSFSIRIQSQSIQRISVVTGDEIKKCDDS